MNERKNERMNERSDERTKERTNEQTNKRTDERTHEKANARTNEAVEKYLASENPLLMQVTLNLKYKYVRGKEGLAIRRTSHRMAIVLGAFTYSS